MKKTLLLLTLALSPALLGAQLPYHILHERTLANHVAEAKDSGKKLMLVCLLNNGYQKQHLHRPLIDSLKSDVLESKDFKAFMEKRGIMVVILKKKYTAKELYLARRDKTVSRDDNYKFHKVSAASGDRFQRVGTCLVNLNNEILAQVILHTKDLTPKDYIDKYKEILDPTKEKQDVKKIAK